MIDAYKELVPVVYGESSIKYLYSEAEADRMCFNMHWHDRMELNLVISGSLKLRESYITPSCLMLKSSAI